MKKELIEGGGERKKRVDSAKFGAGYIMGISVVNKPSEKGKPTARWGHKANGSLWDGRVAGEKKIAIWRIK